MKSKIKNFSTDLLAVALTLCLLASCLTAGVVTAGAAATGTEPVGSGAGYILMGQNDQPSGFTDTGAVVTVSGSTYTATIPKSKFTSTGSNYFFGLSSSTNYANMFFQNSSITVNKTDPNNWISSYGSHSRDSYRFVRMSFSTLPTCDIIVTINANTKTYNISYNDDVETKYSVDVTAGTGGSVLAGSTNIASGTSKTVEVGTTAVSLHALPQSGYKFVNWTKTGSVNIANTTSVSTTMTATGTGTVTANFEPQSTTTRRIYFDNSYAYWSQPYAYTYDAANMVYSADWPGTKMTLYKDKVWYVDVSTDATKVIFNQGNSTNQTSGLTIPTNLSRPTYYRHMGTSPSWGEYEDISTGNKKYVTSPINNQSSSVELYTDIDATFYDYYTNGEYNNGYWTGIVANTEGWVSGISERYPYKQFDKSLSEYAEKNSVSYPMYYLAGYYNQNNEGDRYHPGGWYNEGDWNWGNGRYINDSNQLGGNTKAVTGLSGLTLADGIIHHYKSGATNQNGVKMAMFDEDWLTSRSQGTFASNNDKYTYGGTLATMIYSKFPVRKTTTAAGYNRIYLDISQQTWWTDNSNKIIAHLWNSPTDFVDIEMTREATNFYSVDCTGFNSVLFYRGTKFGEYNNQTYNLTIPPSNSTNRTYVVNSQSGNYCGGYWTGTSSTYYNRDKDEAGQTYYEFDSTGGKDNIWFDDPTSDHPIMSYGSGSTYAVKNGYNGKSSFMPFDKYNNTYVSGKTGVGKDFGFGMKLEINFTLGRDFSGTPQTNSNYGKETGIVDGHEQKFNFSGDDDLWVYVDDQLILDMGGDHAMTTGSINFATKSVTTNPTPFTGVNNVSRNGSFTLADKEVHKMTIYYTERGMHESNLKFGFSFAPVDTDLKVDKVVSPANVNTGLVEDVLAAAEDDEFSIYHTYDTSKNGSYSNNIGNVVYVHTDENGNKTTKTTASGTYTLKESESARFTNTFHKADYLDRYFKLTERTDGNLYSYTPSFTVVDRETGVVLPTLTAVSSTSAGITRTGGTFKFNNDKGRDGTNATGAAFIGDMTPVNIDATFTNKIVAHNLMLNKHVLGFGGSPGDTFTVKVEVDVDGDGSNFGYKPYALTYFGSSTETMSASTGTVTLHADDTIVIPGIPEGASVRVTEIDMGDAYEYDSMDVTGGTAGGTLSNGKWFTMTSDVEVDINNVSGGYLTITHDLYPTVEQEQPYAAKCGVSAKVKNGAATVAIFAETLDPLVIGPEYIKPGSTNTLEITLRTYDVDIYDGWSFTKYWEYITGAMRTLATQGLLAEVSSITIDPDSQETTVVITTKAISNLFNADKEQEIDWLPFYSELQLREDWTCTVNYHYPVERNAWTAGDDCLWDERIETVTCVIDDDFVDDFVKGSINDKVDFYLPNEIFEAYRDDKYTIDILLQVFAPQEEPPSEITWNLSKITEDGVTVYQYHPPLSVKPVTIFNDAQNKTVEIDVYGNIPAGFHLPVGDVNLDGNVNVRDVTAIQRYLADLTEIPDELLILADADGNDIVNINDATWLQLYLAEFVETLGKQQ